MTAFQLQIDPATAAWVADQEDRRWAMFLAYWQGLADRLSRMPRRGDLDPLEISSALLSSIFLIDILPPDAEVQRTRFRFRLIGDEIIAREKVRSGSYLHELGAAADLVAIEQHYHETMALRIRLRTSTLQWEERGKEHVSYKVIMLPLADAAGAIAHLIGYVAYDNQQQSPIDLPPR